MTERKINTILKYYKLLLQQQILDWRRTNFFRFLELMFMIIFFYKE